MKKIFVLLCLIPGCVYAQPQSQVPAVSAGRVERWNGFQSRFVSPRNIDVWLPPAYDGRSRCQVIYMHDGQMLFDPSTTWNKKAWGMADAVALLIRDGKMPATIVVGIWSNGQQRHSEFFPEKALQFMSDPLRTQFVTRALNGKPQADNYLRFLVQEVKPEIDRKYATRPEREHTIIMGSSMGGIISLYAICEYPEVFGAAGCLSTHWLGSFEKNATIPLATFDYLKERIPDPKSHRIYFDHGTETLDSLYSESQAFADVLFREKGYTDESYMSRVFPGAAHTEDAWSQRVAIPLVFLSGR